MNQSALIFVRIIVHVSYTHTRYKLNVQLQHNATKEHYKANKCENGTNSLRANTAHNLCSYDGETNFSALNGNIYKLIIHHGSFTGLPCLKYVHHDDRSDHRNTFIALLCGRLNKMHVKRGQQLSVYTVQDT